MVKITEENTKGKIASYLMTYKNLDFEYGDYNDYVIWFQDYYKNYDSPKKVISFDIETSKLYPVNNKMIMFAVCYKVNNKYKAIAFNSRDWTKKQVQTFIKSMNLLKSKKVLHNAYFDISTLAISYGLTMDWDYDTYIMYHTTMLHRAKDDDDNDWGGIGTGLSLKDLTREFLEYGDYEEELLDYKKEYCKENKLKVKEFSYAYISNEILAPYNCMDVLCTLQLFEKGVALIKVMNNNGYTKLNTLIRQKHDVTKVYIKSRVRGIYIDRNKVKDLGNYYKELMQTSYNNIMKDLGEYIQKAERYMYMEKLEQELMKDFEYIAENRPKVSKTGKETYVSKQVKITDSKLKKIREESKINLNSSKQKALLFCDIMGLKPLELTKGGSPQCNIAFMEHYSETHPELQSFIDYGKCRTALNNFLGVDEDVSNEEIDDDTKTLWGLTRENLSYVYPSYNLNGTITSRASNSTPNLQQFPSRGIISKIKGCISARPNHYFIYSDYSSAEIVILASTIQSKSIHQSLENGWDLHSVNVWKMLKDRVLKDDPSFETRFKECGNDPVKLKEFYASIKAKYESTLRYQCKSLQFSLSYGTTKHGVSKNLGISKNDAQDLIDRFMLANPEMKKYIEFQHNKAKTLGYTENPFGLRLLLPDCKNMYNAHDRNTHLRGEKQLKKALNYPIQSSNAYLLYNGIIKAEKLLKEKGLSNKVHFMFSVYDSFCYEVENGVDKETVLDILERSFCCYLGDYYLGIDSEIGSNWKDVEGIKRPRRNKEDVDVYEMNLY